MKSCNPPGGIEQGSTVRIRGKLTVDCVLTDALQVTVTVRDPAKTVTNPDVVLESTGDYYTDIEVETPGQWKFRIESNDPVGAEEGSFVVRKSQVLT